LSIPEVAPAIEMDEVAADAQLEALKENIRSGDF
jgi:hypothetical protein